MNKDELLGLVQSGFKANVENDKRAQELLRKIESGKGTYEDAQNYSFRVGEILSGTMRNAKQFLGEDLTAEDVADGIIEPMLERACGMAGKASKDTINSMLDNCNIGIRAQDGENAKGIISDVVNKASEKENGTEAMEYGAGSASTATGRTSDDVLKTNGEFLSEAGFHAKIVRTYEGPHETHTGRGSDRHKHSEMVDCEWCQSRAGEFAYPNVPEGTYGRHEGCKCVVEFYPAGGRQRQNVWTKGWEPLDNPSLREDNEQYYRAVRSQYETSFDVPTFQNIKTHEIEGLDRVYVQDGTKLKPKQIHEIDMRTRDAMREYGIPADRKPTIVILKDKYEYKPWEEAPPSGLYDAVTHTVYYSELIKEEKGVRFLLGMNSAAETIDAIEWHEMWHLKQAEDFRNRGWVITKENHTQYMNALCEEKKRRLDKLGIKGDNVKEISDYALEKYATNRFDEVEAEYEVFTRKGKGK